MQKSTLELEINGKKYSTDKQYLTGADIKKMGNIALEDSLFLDIESPWPDELIENEKEVNLARPGIESFNSRAKHPDSVILTIETTKGVWHNAAFKATLKIADVIQLVIRKFGFAPDGKYALKVKGQTETLDEHRTLQSYHFSDCTHLVFTDLGNGA